MTMGHWNETNSRSDWTMAAAKAETMTAKVPPLMELRAIDLRAESQRRAWPRPRPRRHTHRRARAGRPATDEEAGRRQMTPMTPMIRRMHVVLKTRRRRLQLRVWQMPRQAARPQSRDRRERMATTMVWQQATSERRRAEAAAVAAMRPNAAMTRST